MAERQTVLSLLELSEILLENKQTYFPLCLLVNEVGAEYLNGNSEAEKILLSLLSNEQEYIVILAVCFLQHGNCQEEKFLRFRKDPQNVEIINGAQAIIARADL